MAKIQQTTQKPQWRRTLIREWRLHRGMTLAQLADALEMNEGYLSELENGKRRYNQDILEKAAVALGTTEAHLLYKKPVKGEEIDYSDPYLASVGMSAMDEEDRKRVGGVIKSYAPDPKVN